MDFSAVIGSCSEFHAGRDEFRTLRRSLSVVQKSPATNRADAPTNAKLLSGSHLLPSRTGKAFEDAYFQS